MKEKHMNLMFQLMATGLGVTGMACRLDQQGKDSTRKMKIVALIRCYRIDGSASGRELA
tara:strand:+ start:909 stop:1085 length:177 start_codon:yes stop_codon:yes gene_type:complete